MHEGAYRKIIAQERISCIRKAPSFYDTGRKEQTHEWCLLPFYIRLYLPCVDVLQIFCRIIRRHEILSGQVLPFHRSLGAGLASLKENTTADKDPLVLTYSTTFSHAPAPSRPEYSDLIFILHDI